MPEDDKGRSAAKADDSDNADDDGGQSRTESAEGSAGSDRQGSRRGTWLPVLAIVAAILVGAGGIAAAIMVGSDRLNEPPASQAQTAFFAGPACKAWEDARRELESIPPLKPAGEKDTPDTQKALKEQQAAVGPVLNTFELRINDLPPDEITALGTRYIEAQRSKMERQADGTASAIDLDMVNAGYTWLNRACGLPG